MLTNNDIFLQPRSVIVLSFENKFVVTFSLAAQGDGLSLFPAKKLLCKSRILFAAKHFLNSTMHEQTITCSTGNVASSWQIKKKKKCVE